MKHIATFVVSFSLLSCGFSQNGCISPNQGVLQFHPEKISTRCNFTFNEYKDPITSVFIINRLYLLSYSNDDSVKLPDGELLQSFGRDDVLYSGVVPPFCGIYQHSNSTCKKPLGRLTQNCGAIQVVSWPPIIEVTSGSKFAMRIEYEFINCTQTKQRVENQTTDERQDIDDHICPSNGQPEIYVLVALLCVAAIIAIVLGIRYWKTSQLLQKSRPQAVIRNDYSFAQPSHNARNPPGTENGSVTIDNGTQQDVTSQSQGSYDTVGPKSSEVELYSQLKR